MLLNHRRGWIGVDIGTFTVKMAQVERRGSEFALSEAVVLHRHEPWPDDDHLATLPRDSQEELVAARALGEGFAGRQAAATLPMAVCQLRSMQIPEMPRREQRLAIANELAGAPQDGGERDFDFWRIDHAVGDKSLVRENVSVLSIADSWASQLADDHRRARLSCRTLDGMPLALTRVLNMTAGIDPTKPVAVLDWGFARATYCIVVGRRPVFVRCLRECGFGQVLRALRTTLSLTWDEAEKLALQYAAGHHSAEASDHDLRDLVMEIVAGPVNQLLEELRRTLAYLQTHRAALVPQQMWLFGGGATIKDIGPWLARQTGLSVAAWSFGGQDFQSTSAGVSPLALLGPAIALSALAWEKV